MTVVNDPHFVSDDDFNEVESAQPVSDLSTPEQPTSPGLSRSGTPKHRKMPSGPYFDTNPKVTEAPLDDSYTSASSWNPKDGETEGQAGDGSILNFTKSVAKRFWSHGDLLIAIMGMTGSGKTTFISKVTGRKDLEIGHSLTSCTRDIQVIETEIEGRVVRFVDTPGFSDTTLSDSEVLQLIADYLTIAYKNNMKLSGIIYLHPISETRVTHHIMKNLQMFQKLTGKENLKNVILATSMWDKVAEEQGLAREQELKNKFWEIMLAFGAKAVRHSGSPESALAIAQMLMENKPFYLQLQEEMGGSNKVLKDTAAGREVMAEITRMKEEHQREIKEMETTMKNSVNQNHHIMEALQEHYKSLLADMDKTLKDERRMNEEAVKSLKERISNLESRSSCALM